MAEQKATSFDQLKMLAVRAKNDSASQISALAELVAAGLEEVQHVGISVSLPAAEWSSGAQTVTHASLLADSNYFYYVGPDADSRKIYDSFGVTADNVTTDGQMVFRCESVPTSDLHVHILRLEVDMNE